MVRHLIFPTTLLLALWVAYLMQERGTPPEAVIVIWFGLMPLIILLERLLPRFPEWNQNQGDLVTDLIYFPTNLIVAGGLSALWAGLYLVLALKLQAAYGQEVWPSHWGLPFQVGAACVIAEFFAYWAHRFMHTVPFLWRFHSVHHSPGRVYWLNAVRAHPGEHVFRGFISGAPLAVLGAGPEVLAYWIVLSRVGGLFQHANIDIALGPFGWIFSIGELHRWHHSARRQEADHNFGDTFIFWDAVFGTRYLPAGEPAPRDVGIEGLGAYPKGWWGQMRAPFRYREIERASRAIGAGALVLISLIGISAEPAQAVADTSTPVPPQIEWKASAGFDYSVGDFGLAEETELIFLPFSLQATRDRFRARVTLPLLHLDGPTGVLPEGTVRGNPGLTRSRNFGLGQATLGASYLLGSSASRLPYLETTVKVTAPTETKTELGSGVWSGALQIDVFDRFGAVTPFAGFGRRFYEGSELDDRFYTSVGASVRAMDKVSVGIVYDWLQATSSAVDDAHQVSPFASIRMGKAWSFSPYAVFGLSGGAADFGAGCSLSYRYSSAPAH